ncbi:MAG TPA: hypothetical protein DEP72_07090 [Clostridiales bacterium]|nr:MAG: hypothetical protein A2Y18_00595 [Clostridiales bacterium GWD2_32_19]HCC07904.1 hypothetical protein [Clostridiales bacterium]
MWMGKKTVIIIAWILVAALVMSVLVGITTVFAADETVATESVVNFSLEEATAYSREHNYDLLISKINKEDIELSKKIMEDLQDTLKDVYSATKGAGDNFDNYKVRNGYSLQVAKNASKMLEQANIFQEKSTEVAVLTAYYALSEKTLLRELKKSTLELINNQVKVCENKLSLGNVSDLVYKTVLLEQTGAEIDSTSADADYIKALMEFNKIIGLPLNTKVNLTSKVIYEKFTMPEYDKKLEDRKNEDLTYAQLLLDKIMVEKEIKMAQAYFGTHEPEYKQIANKIRRNDLSIKKQELEIEYKLKTDIIGIGVLEESIAASEVGSMFAKTIFEITKLKSTLGMATELEVIDAELKVQNAEIKYIQAVHGYNTVILMFERNVVR